MKRFTIIKNTFDDLDMVCDMFKSLVGGRLTMNVNNDIVIFDYEYDNVVDVESLFISLGNELMIDITGYTSSSREEDKLKEELSIAKELLVNLPSGMHDLKSALKGNITINNPGVVLDFILESTGVDIEFIKSFTDNDLNVSKASKEMYIHRNTLNYKLDKLKEISGFDIRKFSDAYILYSLAIKK